MNSKAVWYVVGGIVVLAALYFIFMYDTSDLKIEDIVVGTGAEAMVGTTVSVHYTGWLEDGTKFDASRDYGDEPTVFDLVRGRLIEGWVEGIPGMKVGGKRKLTIPPALGYGNADVGGGRIPPNSTLIFEVELVGVN